MGKTVLTANQRRLLDQACNSSQIIGSFYLTGGTALSEFYYQHRLSEDLDFFSNQEIDEIALLKWASEVKTKENVIQVEQQKVRGQLTFFFHWQKEMVKVDFSYFPFEHIGEYKLMGNLRIASVDDIATNKLQAILTRNRARDFYDLFVINDRIHLDLIALQKTYRLKFDVMVSNQELAKKCFGVFEAVDMPKFLGDVDWKMVENYFEQQAKLLMKSV